MALSGAWCPEQSQICNVQMLQCLWGACDSVEDVVLLC